MGKLPIDDPDCFWSHAEAARIMAEQMIDPEAKRMMIIVAGGKALGGGPDLAATSPQEAGACLHRAAGLPITNDAPPTAAGPRNRSPPDP
jgi:hypothetical protein